MRRLTLIVFLGLGIACAAYYLLAVSPWVADPDESFEAIEQRWQWVHEQAGTPEECSGDALQLEAALQDIDEAWSVYERELVDEGAGTVNAVPYDDLPREVRMRVQLLIAWDVAEGGLGERVGTWGGLDVLATLRLGMMAASSLGDGSGHGQLEALLALSRRLYECGNLVEAALGLRLTEIARETAERAGLGNAAFRTWTPAEPGIFDALAREAVNSVGFIETTLAEESWTEGAGATGVPEPALWLISIERELAMLKQFLGRQLEVASAHRESPHEMAPLVAVPGQDDLPRSVLVRIAAAGYNHIVETMATQIDDYRAFAGRE